MRYETDPPHQAAIAGTRRPGRGQARGHADTRHESGGRQRIRKRSRDEAPRDFARRQRDRRDMRNERAI